MLVAVSGGADSVALLRALVSIKANSGGRGQLFVGHFDHRLRPDSATDAAWVAEFCRRLDLPFELGAADVATTAANSGDGLENAARDSRYAFLRRAAARVGARYVTVAHTRDDQVETVLHHIVRGTGLSGLTGMPWSRPLSECAALVRPLIFASRGQVLDYLRRIGQEFCSDPSNADERFTRNRIRRQLLPLLRSQFNRDVDRAILRLARQADEAHQAILAIATRLLADSSVVSTGRIEIECAPLRMQPPHLVREVCRLAWDAAGLPLQSMGFDEWSQLAELVAGKSTATLSLPGSLSAARRDERIVVAQSL